MEPLLTVGHGRLDADALIALLQGADVGSVVDVRRFPGSRRNPTVSSEHLATTMPAASIEYRWDERLGGRRRLPESDTEDPWWTVDSFRAYAAHTRSAEFSAAMTTLMADADRNRTAVLCSESVWWRCHRRLIADVVTIAHERDVLHLMPDGSLRPHRLAEGARVSSSGRVVWDGSAGDRLDP